MTPSDPSLPRRYPLQLSLVARASLLVSFFFAIDKLLGLVRQVIIGRQFGVSAELDAFNAANNIPDLLFALISGGALAIALIPVLSETLKLQDRPAMWRLFSRVANWAFLITAGLAVVVYIFAAPLVGAELGIAPGFTTESQALVVDLMRLNLIATLLFSLSGLVMAGLQSNQHFLLPAMAPVLYDVGQIFGALVLAPSQPLTLGPLTLPALGLGVYGLVYGVILGAGLHLLIQIPGLVRFRFRWAPILGTADAGLHKVARMMGPRILTIAAFNLVFVAMDNLASRLEVGSVTALVYGWLVMQLPETLLATAVGTALLPTLSERFAVKDEGAFGRSIALANRAMVALTIPIAVLLGITLYPFVSALFGFDLQDTQLVVRTAQAFLLGLTGHSLLEVVARGFYARQNARIPLLGALLGLVIFVVFGLMLYQPLGSAGIALANSLAFTLQALLLWVLLGRRYPEITRLGAPLLRGLGAAALGGVVAWLLLGWLPIPALLAGIVALVAGSLAALPLVFGELRALARL
jgi:putative peptidoglycan lipid II flippase